MDWLAKLVPLGLLAEYFIKSSLVLIAALALAAACRKKSAALRHFILALFLGGLLVLPFFSRVPGGWTSSWIPARNQPVQPQPAAITAAEPWAGEMLVRYDSLAMTRVATTDPGPANKMQAVPLRLASKHPISSVSAAGWLTLAWIVGALFVFLRLVLGLAAARRLTKEGSPMPDPAWRMLLERFMAAVSLKRSVRLRSHGRVAVPFTWGLVRPVVLMPAETETWSEDERSTALFHELSHIKRVDFLIMLLVRLSLAVYWLNPLTWVVFGALRREQEKACDELVLRAGIKPSTYAENLLRFREKMNGRWSPAVALLGLFGKPQLSERLAAILKHQLNLSEVKMKTKVFLVCIVVLTLVLIGMARPAASSVEKAPKPAKAPAAVAATKTPAPATPAAVVATPEAETTPAAVAGTPVAATAPESIAATPAGEAAPEAMEAPVAQTEAATLQAQSEPDKDKTPKAKTEPEDKTAYKKIIFEPKAGEKGQIEIIVTGGDKAVKKIMVDKPVVLIRTDSADKPILVTSDGKEIKLDAGSEVRLEVRDGNWAMLKEGKAIKLDKGDVFYIAEPTIKEGKAIRLDKGNVVYMATPAPPEVGIPVAVAEAAPGALTPPAAVAQPAAPGMPDKGVAYVIASAPVAEAQPVKIKLVDWELAEKLKAIREQLKQVKENKLGLDDVDKSLADLEESLKKHDFLIKNEAVAAGEYGKTTTYVSASSGEAKPGEVHLVPSYAAGSVYRIKTKDIGTPAGEDKPVVVHFVPSYQGSIKDVTIEKEGIKIIYVGKSGQVSKERYDAAVNRVKKELPVGYTLEPAFEKESGKVVFIIRGTQGSSDEVTVLLEKLTKIIENSLKEESPKQK